MNFWPWVSRSKLLLIERQLRETRAALDQASRRLEELEGLCERQQDQLIVAAREREGR